MFIVLLRFSEDRGRAAQLMEDHRQWIERGFADGVFILTGSLAAAGGGAILAHDTSRPDLEDRVKRDPFVAEGVVAAEILEVTPSRVDDRLGFLRG
jgi:uncharacterized protein YciI